MIYFDDNIHEAFEKAATENVGLQTIKGRGGFSAYSTNVRRHNRYVRSGGKRGKIMPVSPSTWTKTSSDNIHEALEKVASDFDVYPDDNAQDAL